MAASTFVNGVSVYSNSAGTGPLVLGDAVTTFRGIDALTDGDWYSYGIQIDGDVSHPDGDYEFGHGVYDVAAGTLTRNVYESSNADAPIAVILNAIISLTVLAQDFAVTDQAALAAAILNAQGSANDAAADAASTAADRIATHADRLLADTAASDASGSASATADEASAAAGSAAAAATSAITSTNAATASGTFAGQSSASAIASAGSATAAAGSASAASTSAIGAGNSATAASGSASTASAAATLAGHFANDSTNVTVPGQADPNARGAQYWSLQSGISAVAAGGSATTASTQAGIATTQASNSATSATLAGHFANDSTNVQVPGQADTAARGAKYWSLVAQSWATNPIAQTYTVTDNGGTAQTDFLHVMPTSVVNSEGGFDNVNLSIRITKNFFTAGNGQFGTDYVFAIGWNIGPALFPEMSGKPATMFKIESKFIYNRFGTYVIHAEVHVSTTVTADVTPLEMRAITTGNPHYKADWANFSGISYQTSYHSFLTGDISPVEWMTFDARAVNGGTRYINTINTIYRESVNNIAPRRQFNAALSAYINDWFVNAANHLKAESPLDIAANATVNAFGNVAIIGIAGSTPNGGAVISHTDFNNTGTTTILDVRGSASTCLEQNQENQHASGASGYNVAGKAALYFGFIDTANFLNYGVRYVASTQKLSIGGQLRGASNGVGDFLTFDCLTKQAVFAYPVGLRQYTVSTLPTPTAALAGSICYATNARNAGEGAAAGTGSLVECNVLATFWKIPGIATAVAA